MLEFEPYLYKPLSASENTLIFIYYIYIYFDLSTKLNHLKEFVSEWKSDAQMTSRHVGSL